MSMDLTTSPDPGNLAEATELHRYAEALIVSLAADGTAPDLPPGITDVPGYWLGPAVGALVLIRSGKDALEPLALANELDERRTALFLCLALAVCGHGDRIHASWLGTAFGDLSEDRPVTSGQRALWLAAARGAYGPVGKIFVLRKLDAVNVPATDDRWLKALVPALPETSVPASLEAFPELAKVAEIERSLRASVTLRRLRDRCTEITSTRQAGEVTKVVRGTVWAEDEPLAVLRALAGQGGQEGPLSSLTGHLLQDLAPDADPHMAALALHVAAPAVRGRRSLSSRWCASRRPTRWTCRSSAIRSRSGPRDPTRSRWRPRSSSSSPSACRSAPGPGPDTSSWSSPSSSWPAGS
ncbi:hypothetical protein GCM10027612_85760 [Microbispora bryophytorum subsp. camponoti]